MFHGLSAFPLTPIPAGRFDEGSFARIIGRAVAAGADSIGALGSTGSAAYLDRAERAEVARAAVRHAQGVPVVVGISALRTAQVFALAEDAQAAGASAVMLAPVTYQALSPDEVLGLYQDVTAQLSIPLVLYDNPATTHVTFTTELYGEIARLPCVAAIKIPPFPGGTSDPAAARARIAEIRAAVPTTTRIGISGDAVGALGLVSGCDVWFSAVGGILPQQASRITRLALGDDVDAALRASRQLRPVWDLVARHGSLRVSQAIGEFLGIVPPGSLPRPVQALGADAAARLAQALREAGADTT